MRSKKTGQYILSLDSKDAPVYTLICTHIWIYVYFPVYDLCMDDMQKRDMCRVTGSLHFNKWYI